MNRDYVQERDDSVEKVTFNATIIRIYAAASPFANSFEKRTPAAVRGVVPETLRRLARVFY